MATGGREMCDTPKQSIARAFAMQMSECRFTQEETGCLAQVGVGVQRRVHVLAANKGGSCRAGERLYIDNRDKGSD